MRDTLEILKELVTRNESRIVFLVMDGVGGLRSEEFPQTELERAKTPNLDSLALNSTCGRSLPVSWGITPGSGPGHLGIFGYDPLIPQNNIGRGVLEALGIDFDMQKRDVAARGNFAQADDKGIIINRRAGRLATEECVRICNKLQTAIKEIDGVEVLIRPVKEYRFVLVLRGDGLGQDLADTDPQKTGLKTLEPRALKDTPENLKTVEVLKKVISRMMSILKDETTANSFLLRGFSRHPGLETMQERYQLKPCAIATYPLYRGVAKLIGMEVQQLPGEAIADEFTQMEKLWSQYDFFFIHIKKTDSYGEDGNREGRIKIIEEVDVQIPRLMALNPDVIVVTGDHSTPPAMKGHSWHPVPLMIYSKFCDRDAAVRFTEAECDKGGLGIIPAKEIMWMAMANAGKLIKFGA